MASKNGNEGRVYGGDCDLIHIADGKRAEAGQWLARQLDYEMRRRAQDRTTEQKETQALCPGCYMIAGYNMLIALAEDNDQSLKELGASMAPVFQMLAEGKEFNREEIEVLLDKDEESWKPWGNYDPEVEFALSLLFPRPVEMRD